MRLKRQSANDDPQVPTPATKAHTTPQALPPFPRSREGTVANIKIADFLKPKPPVFAREDANDDPNASWMIPRRCVTP